MKEHQEERSKWELRASWFTLHLKATWHWNIDLPCSARAVRLPCSTPRTQFASRIIWLTSPPPQPRLWCLRQIWVISPASLSALPPCCLHSKGPAMEEEATSGLPWSWARALVTVTQACQTWLLLTGAENSWNGHHPALHPPGHQTALQLSVGVPMSFPAGGSKWSPVIWSFEAFVSSVRGCFASSPSTLGPALVFLEVNGSHQHFQAGGLWPQLWLC
jgi:hypothetical protein